MSTESDIKALDKIFQDFIDVPLDVVKDDDVILDIMDSLDFVEMIMEIEDEFGIEIPDTDSDVTITIANLKDLIKRKIAEK